MGTTQSEQTPAQAAGLRHPDWQPGSTPGTWTNPTILADDGLMVTTNGAQIFDARHYEQSSTQNGLPDASQQASAG